MAALPGLLIRQHERPVPVQNISGVFAREFLLDQPVVADTVSNASLMLIACFVPLGVSIVLSFISPARGAVRAFVHAWLWTMATQLLVVGCLKAYCGYWRPIFLDECGFDAASGQCTQASYLHAYRSFPSGHASTATSSLLLTSLRLIGALRLGAAPRRLGLGRPGLYFEFDSLLTALSLLPTFLAAWIAGSRVHDNAHHPADVVGGALVGGGAAVLWYLRYFRGLLFGADAHQPRRE